MNLPDFQDLDLSIARARIALSLIAMLSLYIDPSTAGGLFHLNAYALTTLLCHLAYSVGIYFALGRRFAPANLEAQLRWDFLDSTNHGSTVGLDDPPIVPDAHRTKSDVKIRETDPEQT